MGGNKYSQNFLSKQCGIGSLHDKLIINKGLLVLKNVIQFLKVTPLQNVDYLDKIGSNFSGFWLFCCSVFRFLVASDGLHVFSLLSSIIFLLRLTCKAALRHHGPPTSLPSAGLKGSVVTLKHKSFKNTKCF